MFFHFLKIKPSVIFITLVFVFSAFPFDCHFTLTVYSHKAPQKMPIGLMAGRFGGTYLHIANDLAEIASHHEMRVIPMVGQGSVQALDDLISLLSVDIAIFQVDVINLAKRANPTADLQGRLRYITALYPEELHLLARRDISSIWELEGQPVSIGPLETGTAMTSLFVLADLGIDIDARPMTSPDALAALRRGEIAAMIRIVGQPASPFQELLDRNLHFLPIPADRVKRPYRPAQLMPESYPDLIDSHPVETVSVQAVMATILDPKRPERQERVEQFARTFLSSFEELRGGNHHPKWHEVDPTLDLPGWHRLAAAEEAVAASAYPKELADGR